MKTHRDLKVWQMAIDFVTEIYRVTEQFPKQEQFGLTSQLRRASISVPSNIAEGASRKSNKDFIRFLDIARSSAVELETQLIIAYNLGYLKTNSQNVQEKLLSITKMLSALINNVMSKK